MSKIPSILPKGTLLLSLWLAASPARADVRISVQDVYGLAWINYECTAGEVVRAFALDVSVDRGFIIGISGFFRGASRAGATGYGIFPAAFRDHIVVDSSGVLDWEATQYTPLAVPADDPLGTLPGLNSNGVTLEFGALWDPGVPDAIPGSSGNLCALQLSGPAKVSVRANVSRGGIVSALPGPISPVFIGSLVGPVITSTALQNGEITVTFQGGELQTATSPDGEWMDTGNTSGVYTEPVDATPAVFYRVRGFSHTLALGANSR